MEEKQQSKEQKPKKSRTRRGLKGLLWTVLSVLFVFLLVLYLILQSNRFQNWVIPKITDAISNKIGSPIQIKHVDIDIMQRIVLDSFLVKDLNQDTLLYSEKLSIGLEYGLLSLFSNSLSVDELKLSNSKLHFTRAPGAYRTSSNLYFRHVFNKDKKKKSKQSSPFNLNIKTVLIDQLKIQKLDSLKGENMFWNIPQGKILLNDISIANKNIDVKKLDVDDLGFSLETFNRNETEYLDWEKWINNLDSLDVIRFEAESIPYFSVALDDAHIKNGTFSLHQYRQEPKRLKPLDELDYHHMEIDHIDLQLQNIFFIDNSCTGQLKSLSCKEASGFELADLCIDSISVNRRKMALFDVDFQTENSAVGDSLFFSYKKYEDFLDYNDHVKMDFRLHHTVVNIEDLMVFAPKLKNVKFFKDNHTENIVLDGQIKGKVNNLKGKNLNVKLGNGLRLKGKFNSRNLAVKNEEFLQLKLDYLKTHINTIKALLPSSQIPNNFLKLGNLDFTGRFDGFFVDFVADGTLNTDLGQATMNMQFVRSDTQKAKYSGELGLIDFDLQKWTDNPKLGHVTFNGQVKEGQGLTKETAEAKLSAQIAQIQFKGYNYHSLKMDGQLKKNLFTGNFQADDKNLDFDFDGTINFEGKDPVFDFDAKVNILNLDELNFVKQNVAVAGDFRFNIVGMNPSKIIGDAFIANLWLVKNDSLKFQLDSINISSTKVGETKDISIASEVLDLNINGLFDIKDVPYVFQHYFSTKYPGFAASLKIKSPKDVKEKYAYTYNVNIKDSKNWTKLIDIRLDTILNAKMRGYIDNVTDSLFVDLEIPKVKFDNILLNDIYYLSEGKGSVNSTQLGVYNSIINGRNFSPLIVEANWLYDTITFNVNSTNFTESLDNLNLRGRLFPVNKDVYEISFLPSNLAFFDKDWNIAENNFIRFGNNHIETQNFKLFSDEKIVQIDSYNDTGLKMDFLNFDLNIIDEIWDNDKFNFNGNVAIQATIDDVFKLKGMDLDIESEAVYINDDYWGRLKVSSDFADKHSVLNYQAKLDKEDQVLKVDGQYYSKNYESTTSNFSNHLVMNVDGQHFPLSFMEYLIRNGISNTQGKINAKGTLVGPPKALEINGDVDVLYGSTKVDYLGATYHFDNQFIKITTNRIDATGVEIHDRMNNTATITGGLTHNRFKNMGMDLQIDSDRFLGLDTDEHDNPNYYGQGLGEGHVKFYGDFIQPYIDVTATTGEGCKLFIPFFFQKDGSELSYVTFVDRSKKDSLTTTKGRSIEGLNLLMNITMTEAAETQIIFDSKAGDIIRGRGNGNIQLNITRDGKFEMVGDYEFSQGNYLFTIKDFFINKPFEIKKGGVISWTGDPFDADIQLTAEYKGVRASPYGLINSIVEGSELGTIKQESRRLTDVLITMYLTEKLLKPKVAFEIELPNLTGTVRTLVDNQLRVMYQDPNALNRQVFGLIVLGSFLPESGVAGAIFNSGAVEGTLGQYLSSQISILVSNYLTENLKDNDFIKGIDFGLGYNRFGDEAVGVISQRELQPHLQLFLKNDRFIVGFDGNIGFGNVANATVQGATTSFNSGDIYVEYKLTDSGQVTARALVQGEKDYFLGSRRKGGLGLNFQKEFEKWSDLFK